MTLRQLAATDLQAIVEDEQTGFGWPITVTSPGLQTAALTGLSSDISQTIDPETGQAIAGRVASVALSLASLSAAGLGVPRNVSELSLKPWVVEFSDIGGAPHKFKVTHAMPDRTLGIVTCVLEAYE